MLMKQVLTQTLQKEILSFPVLESGRHNGSALEVKVSIPSSDSNGEKGSNEEGVWGGFKRAGRSKLVKAGVVI